MPDESSAPQIESYNDSIRWTRSQICEEFGCDTRTLGRAIAAAESILPGGDGCFSTRQVAAILYGDLRREKLEIAKEERLALVSARMKRDGKLIDVEEWAKKIEPIAVSIVSTIENSDLPDDKKEELRKNIAGLLG